MYTPTHLHCYHPLLFSYLLTVYLHNQRDFVERVLHYRTALNRLNTNQGELTAFIAYAQAYPKSFLALLDTYDTLESGLPNFAAVALALYEFGYTPRGIRLDSGDLAYLSRETRKYLVQISEQFHVPFDKLSIVASNDLSEKVLWALKEQQHEIDAFAIGTHLVTCKTQPALGCTHYAHILCIWIERACLSSLIFFLLFGMLWQVYTSWCKSTS